MRIVFMGTPEFAVPVLEGILAAGHEVCAVYTQPPRPAGRGKKDRGSPVQMVAEGYGLEVRHPVDFRAAKECAEFTALETDVAVVVAYGLILPRDILDAPRHGCLNIHASLLPRWRGAAPIQRAIMAGDAESGICVMQMEAGLDTGAVLETAKTQISAHDTTARLQDRLSLMGRDAVLQVLDDGISGKAVPQSKTGVLYANKIEKSEAEVDWRRPAREVDRHIRGLSPFPGAWTMLDGQRVKLLMSSVAEGHGSEGANAEGANAEGAGAAGEVLNDRLRVACGSGALDLLRLQRAGKDAMEREVFLRGYPIARGARLGETG